MSKLLVWSVDRGDASEGLQRENLPLVLGTEFIDDFSPWKAFTVTCFSSLILRNLLGL